MSGLSAMIIRVYAVCPSPPCITDNDHDGLSNEEELMAQKSSVQLYIIIVYQRQYFTYV